jgi:hypothetical protein
LARGGRLRGKRPYVYVAGGWDGKSTIVRPTWMGL